MKKLAVLTVLLFLSACANTKVLTVPEYSVHKIPKPNKPVLLQLDEKKHIAHSNNIDVLVQNINRMIIYTNSLEDVIDKYEIQADSIKGTK